MKGMDSGRAGGSARRVSVSVSVNDVPLIFVKRFFVTREMNVDSAFAEFASETARVFFDTAEPEL